MFVALYRTVHSSLPVSSMLAYDYFRVFHKSQPPGAQPSALPAGHEARNWRMVRRFGALHVTFLWYSSAANTLTSIMFQFG